MQEKLISDIVTDSLDWFFVKVLKDHYQHRRQTLSDANIDPTIAIDHVLRSCDQDFHYPPDSAAEWLQYYAKLGVGDSTFLQQILLIYLKLDANYYLTRKEFAERTRTKDKSELASIETALVKLIAIPEAFDYPNSILQLATGLWAIDNDDIHLAVASLSYTTIELSSYFESPKTLCRIITNSFILAHQPRMALFMLRAHHCANTDDIYDPIYSFLLLSSGQLIEALKYERMFSQNNNYRDILHRFFEMCSQLLVIKSLNCLDLSIEEEEVLNQYLTCESRTVTPSGTQTKVKSTSKPKPRNRNIQAVQRTPTFEDSPARNTRSARKKKN